MKSAMGWDKFKDVAILFLLGFAIRVFHANMEAINKSVTELNAKVGVVIAVTETHQKEIDTLRSQVRELEISSSKKGK